MVYIETLAIGVPICLFFVLFIVMQVTLYINKWRYKEENDKGRRFERPENSRIGTENIRIGKESFCIPRIEQPEERRVLPIADDPVEAIRTSTIGKTSNSNRKVRFRRRK